MRLKNFTYTKADGSTSERTCLIIKAPQTNYLMLDLSDLTDSEQSMVIDMVDATDLDREDVMSQIDDMVKWRTFKPEGIEWHD